MTHRDTANLGALLSLVGNTMCYLSGRGLMKKKWLLVPGLFLLMIATVSAVLFWSLREEEAPTHGEIVEMLRRSSSTRVRKPPVDPLTRAVSTLQRGTASNPPKEAWEWEPEFRNARRTYLTKRHGTFCVYRSDLRKAKRLGITARDRFVAGESTCGYFGGGTRVRRSEHSRDAYVSRIHLPGSDIEFWTSDHDLEIEQIPLTDGE